MDIDQEEYTTDNLMSVLVEITTYCNMACSYCIRTIKDDNSHWQNQHMKVSDFQYIVDSLPPAGEIITQGVGEPTMHPHLPEIVRIASAAKKFQNITLTTNAMLRNESYYQDLFDSGLTKLYISVDSMDRDLANQLRAGTSVERLKEMIPLLAASFPRKIGIRTTVGKNNIESIPSLLSSLNAIGPLDVYMHPYDDIGNPNGCLSPEVSAQFQDRVSVLAKDFSNLRVIANGFIPSEKVCIHPWRIPAITVDGYLVPCCRTMDENIYTFGNVISSRFSEVWESDGAQGMRKEFSRESPQFCTGCPRYVIRKIQT